MSEENQELPKKEANPTAKKGFRQVKGGNKKELKQENNVLKQQLQAMQQSQQFLGQQVFSMMQAVREMQSQSQAMANLLRYKQVEGEVQSGDSVMIDFAGILEETGEPFDGGFMLGSVVTLGQKRFLEDFEKQLEGMIVGQMKDLKVKFPDNYTEELKGKTAIFTVKVINAFRPDESDSLIQDLQNKRVQSVVAQQKEQDAKSEEEKSSKA